MMTPETAVIPFWPQGPVWPMLILIWPLLVGALAGLPGLREKPLRLLPLAPLPALLLALARPGENETLAPDVLLGVVLKTDTLGLTLLGMTAAIWLAAGALCARLHEGAAQTRRLHRLLVPDADGQSRRLPRRRCGDLLRLFRRRLPRLVFPGGA